MRGLGLWLCMFTSFPNFDFFVFICQFEGFLFGAILVHAHARVSVCTVRQPAY